LNKLCIRFLPIIEREDLRIIIFYNVIFASTLRPAFCDTTARGWMSTTPEIPILRSSVNHKIKLKRLNTDDMKPICPIREAKYSDNASSRVIDDTDEPSAESGGLPEGSVQLGIGWGNSGNIGC